VKILILSVPIVMSLTGSLTAAPVGELCDSSHQHQISCGADLVCKSFWRQSKGVCLPPVTGDQRFCYHTSLNGLEYYTSYVVTKISPSFHAMHDQLGQLEVQFLASTDPAGDVLIISEYLDGENGPHSIHYSSGLNQISVVELPLRQEAIYCLK
jgi:hypothetical protein